MCVCVFRPQQFAWELLSLNPCQGFRGTSSKSLPSTSSVSCLSRWHLFFQLMLKSKQCDQLLLMHCGCFGLSTSVGISLKFLPFVVSIFYSSGRPFHIDCCAIQHPGQRLILCGSVGRTGQSLTTVYPSGTVRALPVAMSALIIYANLGRLSFF